MSWTDYYRHTNGADTLYALPLTTGAWSATGKIVGDDSSQDGLYVFAGLTDATDYEVFLQAGGSAAEGDTALARFSAPVNVTNADDSTLDEEGIPHFLVRAIRRAMSEVGL